MNREWLEEGAAVPVTCETVTELIAEIKRLIDVGSGMALAQPAQRTWVGLTDEERKTICNLADADDWHDFQVMDAVETKLKEKNA